MKYLQLLFIVVLLFLIFAIRGRLLWNNILININLAEPQLINYSYNTNVLAEVNYDDPVTIWREGYLFWEVNQIEDAKEIWQISPEYAAQMLMANIQINGDPNYEMLKTMLILDPHSTEISEFAAAYLLSRGEQKFAYRLFEDVVKHNPKNGVATAVLALTSYNTSTDLGEASLELFDKAITLDPENTEVLRYSLRYVNNRSDLDKMRIQNLIDLLEAQEPKDFELTFGLANAYRQIGDPISAEKYNLIALSIEQNHPWANLLQVELRQESKNSDVQPWLNQAIEFRVQSRPDYLNRLILVLVAANRLEIANTIYCEAIQYGYQPELPSSENEILIGIENC